MAAHSAAAGTVREACAEVARETGDRELPRIPSENGKRKDATVTPVPGGIEELPEDAGAFVDEVHRRADLIEIQKVLLNSADEKIRQRGLERLLEMKYSKGSAAAEETPQIVIDVARPNRIPKEETEER